MKLSVNKATLTGLCARNCATIQQVFILEFAFGPRKATGPFEKPAPGSRKVSCLFSVPGGANSVRTRIDQGGPYYFYR